MTKDRLIALLATLQGWQDNYRVPYQLETDFLTMKGELADIIDTYEDAAPAAPVVVQNFVDAVDVVQQITSAMADQIEASDVVVLAAVEAGRNDVLAALAPAA